MFFRLSPNINFSNIDTGQTTEAVCIRPPIQLFVDWDNVKICKWISDIDFKQYLPEIKRYIRSGRHLLNLTPNEYEKV